MSHREVTHPPFTLDSPFPPNPSAAPCTAPPDRQPLAQVTKEARHPSWLPLGRPCASHALLLCLCLCVVVPCPRCCPAPVMPLAMPEVIGERGNEGAEMIPPRWNASPGLTCRSGGCKVCVCVGVCVCVCVCSVPWHVALCQVLSSPPLLVAGAAHYLVVRPPGCPQPRPG